MQTDLNPPKHVVPSIPRAGDTRKGLGYGQLEPRFQKPWKMKGTYPYPTEDRLEDEDDFEIEKESHDSVLAKTPNFQPTDAGAFKSANRMYYVGATTQLAACFERPDEILSEIGGVGRGIVPIPGLYQNFDGPAVGGFSTSPVSFKVGSSKKTGTERGWASIPPESKIEAEIEYEEDIDPDEIYNLKGLADLKRPSLGECFLFISHT